MQKDPIQEEIIEDLTMFEDWTEKYEYLIGMGNELNRLPDEKKNESNLIKGCQSRVWIDAEMNKGKVEFQADSDAIITKGIAALLIKVFSGKTPQEILDTEPYFIEQTDLKDNLSPTRANGLVSMVKKIKTFALAFNSMQKKD
jgi:cysteine desulfuration protein SufE